MYGWDNNNKNQMNPLPQNDDQFFSAPPYVGLDGIEPLEGSQFSCEDTVDGEQCSCNDCPAVCDDDHIIDPDNDANDNKVSLKL